MAQHGSSPTRGAFVVEALRRRILAGDIPAGGALVAADIGKEFGVSTSVIREALTRLSAEGLVQTNVNRGCRVTPLDLDDMWDLTLVRVEIEGVALRRAIRFGEDRWLSDLEAAHEAISTIERPRIDADSADLEAWNDAHRRFHGTLVAACRSPRLISMCEVLSRNAEIFRQYSRREMPQDDRDVPAEHRMIFELTVARDADNAVDALSRHYRATSESIARQMNSTTAQPTT